jgi:hypothetical protein
MSVLLYTCHCDDNHKFTQLDCQFLSDNSGTIYHNHGDKGRLKLLEYILSTSVHSDEKLLHFTINQGEAIQNISILYQNGIKKFHCHDCHQ